MIMILNFLMRLMISKVNYYYNYVNLSLTLISYYLFIEKIENLENEIKDLKEDKERIIGDFDDKLDSEKVILLHKILD